MLLNIDQLRSDLGARGVRLVAIDGRAGSGKSTLARRLADGWMRAVVIEMDDFYRPVAERVRRPAVPGENYDRERLLSDVLEPLASGRAGRYEGYDWAADRLSEAREVPAGAVVLLEGVYSTSAPLREYSEYAIWIECPYDVRLLRGVERDGEEMRDWWVQEWMPAEERYVAAEGPERRADLVLDGGRDGNVFGILAERARGQRQLGARS